MYKKEETKTNTRQCPVSPVQSNIREGSPSLMAFSKRHVDMSRGLHGGKLFSNCQLCALL